MERGNGQLKMITRFQVFCLVSLLLFCTIMPAHAAQMVGGAGGQVAATPISIPRPIRLEKIMQMPGVQQPGAKVGINQAAAPTAMQETIASCELASLHGNEMTLRFQYRIDPARPQPVYAGAWLYDSSRQPIDAGYKPVAIRASPVGTVDVVLVLPEQNFASDYVVTFLMESGRPVFINGRFEMAYNWKNGVLSGPGIATVVAGASSSKEPQSSEAFCQQYAETAIAQFNYATDNGLPGIVPPVWSSDYAHHYNWCVTVPRENATQGTALRQGHLDRFKKAEPGRAATPGIGGQLGVVKTPAMEQVKVIKPSTTKHLDPGLGP